MNYLKASLSHGCESTRTRVKPSRSSAPKKSSQKGSAMSPFSLTLRSGEWKKSLPKPSVSFLSPTPSLQELLRSEKGSWGRRRYDSLCTWLGSLLLATPSHTSRTEVE